MPIIEVFGIGPTVQFSSTHFTCASCTTTYHTCILNSVRDRICHVKQPMLLVRPTRLAFSHEYFLLFTRLKPMWTSASGF